MYDIPIQLNFIADCTSLTDNDNDNVVVPSVHNLSTGRPHWIAVDDALRARAWGLESLLYKTGSV